MGRIVSTEDRHKLPGIYTSVRCFPLDLILKVIGRKSVDLLSLDVEGHEMDVSHFFSSSVLKLHVIVNGIDAAGRAAAHVFPPRSLRRSRSTKSTFGLFVSSFDTYQTAGWR